MDIKIIHRTKRSCIHFFEEHKDKVVILGEYKLQIDRKYNYKHIPTKSMMKMSWILLYASIKSDGNGETYQRRSLI